MTDRAFRYIRSVPTTQDRKAAERLPSPADIARRRSDRLQLNDAESKAIPAALAMLQAISVRRGYAACGSLPPEEYAAVVKSAAREIALLQEWAERVAEE